MSYQYPIPLKELAHPPNEEAPPEGIVEHPHSETPDIRSPDDAVSILRQESRPLVVGLDESPRCAWLTGGRDRNDPYILNWSGSLASSYDFVAFAYDTGVGLVVDERWWSSGWQWAEKGSPYTTSWTPYTLVEDAGAGARPMALYFIWDDGQDMYMAQPPC